MWRCSRARAERRTTMVSASGLPSIAGQSVGLFTGCLSCPCTAIHRPRRVKRASRRGLPRATGRRSELSAQQICAMWAL
jgi:hypothetical protein